MQNRMRILRRQSLRRSITYFLVCSLILNTSLPTVLALDAGNMMDSSGIIGDPVWGDHTIINTQNGAIIDWNNFNTSASQSVRFQQYSGADLSAASAVLNRINSGAVPTRLDGLLNANGRVFIVNPAGVIFGAGSTVNVAQLVASGLNMSDDAFAAVLADESNKMLFAGGSGDVINNGVINAGNSVYLVGENVINNGAILCPGGLVVMAAGDVLQLGQPGSNVIVDVGADLIADNGDSVANNGTVGETGSTVGKLVLAAGDVFSQAIANVGDVAVIARDDVELGDITASGDVEAYSGQRANTSSTLTVNGNIMADSIALQAGDSDGPTNGSHHITVAADRTLHSTVGDIALSAHEHVTLGGDVVADNGSIFAIADSDVLGLGDLHTQGLYAPNGDIELKGRSVTIEDTVNAGNSIKIVGLERMNWGGGTVHTRGTLTTGNGDIEIMVKDTWRSGRDGGETDDYWAGGLIYLGDNVTAGGVGNVKLYNNTAVAADKTLRAGGNLVLGDYESAAAPQITLTGNKSLSLVAGTAGGVDTGEIIAENATINVRGGSLTLDQYLGLDLKNFTIANPGQLHLTARSRAGSVTAVDAANGGKNENAADQWASISAYAFGDITLQGHSTTRDIVIGELYSKGGDIGVTSDFAGIYASGWIGAAGLTSPTEGSVTITAGTDITLVEGALAAHDIFLQAPGAVDAGALIYVEASESASTDSQQLWQLGAKLRYQTDEEPAEQSSPLVATAPVPDEPELEISGCPALTKWAANELGFGGGTVQISLANSPASGGSMPPCDACAGLRRAATVLRDYAGTRIVALSGVISELGPDDIPLSEEQEAAITDAIMNGAEGDAQYALAKEYLDALTGYVGILDSEMDFSATESAEFVINKYVAPLAENDNVGLATFLAARLTNRGGS